MSKFYKVRVSPEMVTKLLTEGAVYSGEYKTIRGLPSGATFCNAFFDFSHIVLIFVDSNPIYVDETVEVNVIFSREEP